MPTPKMPVSSESQLLEQTDDHSGFIVHQPGTKHLRGLCLSQEENEH